MRRYVSVYYNLFTASFYKVGRLNLSCNMVYFRSNPFILGTYNGGSIQDGYNFEMLNTFEMGHLKKTCSHIPSRMDPSQTPGYEVQYSEKPHQPNLTVCNCNIGKAVYSSTVCGMVKTTGI